MSGKKLNPEAIDKLMRTLIKEDRKPSAFAVYIHIWFHTGAFGNRYAHMSHQKIADSTGFSKSTVQAAIRHLTKKQLIESHRAWPTATPKIMANRPSAMRAPKRKKGSGLRLGLGI